MWSDLSPVLPGFHFPTEFNIWACVTCSILLSCPSFVLTSMFLFCLNLSLLLLLCETHMNVAIIFISFTFMVHSIFFSFIMDQYNSRGSNPKFTSQHLQLQELYPWPLMWAPAVSCINVQKMLHASDSVYSRHFLDIFGTDNLISRIENGKVKQLSNKWETSYVMHP